MHDTYNHLRHLFSLSRDAVLGVAGGIVVFANAAADIFWNKSIEGQPAAELLPDHSFTCVSDKLLCSAVICHKPVSISMTREAEVVLICLTVMSEADKPSIDYGQVIALLNSSLHSLRAAAEWLIGNAAENSKNQASMTSAILMRSYFSALRIVKNLAAFQQLSDGTIPFEPVMTDLAEFIGDLVGSVEVLASKMVVNIEFKTTGSDFETCVDQELLELLILSLLSNSLLHMEKGSSVIVSLRSDEDRIIIAVDDNGSGMDDKTLSKLFSRPSGEAALSDRTAGVGLGLRIARGIAEKHGGVIILESRDGEGSSVRIMLPRSVPQNPRFSNAKTIYQSKGMDSILRELSGFLDTDFFRKQYWN